MTTELDHLRAFRAADATAPAAARDAARAALLARIEAAGGLSPAPSLRRTRRNRPSRLIAGLLASAGVAAAVAAFALGLGSGGTRPTDATAAQLLRRAAAVAAHGPDVELRPGQYWYTRSESTSTDSVYGAHSFTVLLHVRREAWIGRDGASRVHQWSVGRPRFVGRGSRAAWIAAGRPRLGMRMDVAARGSRRGAAARIYPFGSGGLTYTQLRQLPVATDALYDRIERAARANRNSHGDAHEMFTIVGDLLRETPVPPALRAALFRVAARIPGVKLRGVTHDAVGRPAVAVALEEDGRRSELLFDPDTAALLGEHDAGGFRVAYLVSGVVDATSQRPKP